MRKWLVLLAVLALAASGCQGELSPELLSPLEGDELDNGGSECSEPVYWEFSWTEVPGATRYQIYIIRAGSSAPYLVKRTTVSHLQWRDDRYIPDEDLQGWTWKVRAGNAVSWWAWSEPRSFVVEPPDQDPSGG